jgi:hypothetical protein
MWVKRNEDEANERDTRHFLIVGIHGIGAKVSDLHSAFIVSKGGVANWMLM